MVNLRTGVIEVLVINGPDISDTHKAIELHLEGFVIGIPDSHRPPPRSRKCVSLLNRFDVRINLNKREVILFVRVEDDSSNRFREIVSKTHFDDGIGIPARFNNVVICDDYSVMR